MTDPLPTFDLRFLDLAGFRRWLDLHLARWATDPVFVQRSRIRDLRREYPELRKVEANQDRAVRIDSESAHGPRLREIEDQLYDAGKAIAGLTDALSRAPAEKQSALVAKRDAFATRRRELEREQAALSQASPQRQELLRATSALVELRTAIGIDRETGRLNQLLTDRGRGAGRAGTAFENEALEVTRTRILPAVAPDSADVHLLRTVRLGAAGVELDIAIVRRPGGPDEPVEVLAVIEAKRNINDLAHGFLRRQIDLAWLTGDRTAYEPAEHHRHLRHRPLQPPGGPLGRPASVSVRPRLVPALQARCTRLLPRRALPDHASRAGLGPVGGGAGPRRGGRVDRRDLGPGGRGVPRAAVRVGQVTCRAG